MAGLDMFMRTLGASYEGFDKGVQNAQLAREKAYLDAAALRDNRQRMLERDMASPVMAGLHNAPTFDATTYGKLSLPDFSLYAADPGKAALLPTFEVPKPVEPVKEEPAAGVRPPAARLDVPRTSTNVEPEPKPTTPSVTFDSKQQLVERNVPVVPTGKEGEYKYKYTDVPYSTGTVFDPWKHGNTVIANISDKDGKISHPAYLEERARILEKLGKAQLAIDPEWKVPGSNPPSIWSWNQLTTFNRDELNFYKNQLSFLDGTVKNAVAKGNATNNPLTTKLVEAKPEERVAVDVLNGYALPKSMNTRFVSLTNQMEKKLQDPKTQGLIARATQLGVDPGSFVATYALENNYGGTATSPKGAMGSLQVMPGTYAQMRTYWMTNGNEAIRKLAATLPVATESVTGADGKTTITWTKNSGVTNEQLTDAGLLYMKYLTEVQGVPKNMLGAAYHAGGGRPEFKQGFVPNVADRGVDSKGRPYVVWTPDYNAMHVGLYNQYATLTNGAVIDTPTTKTGQTGTGNEARNVTINNSGATRVADSGVTAVVPPANTAVVPPANAAADAKPADAKAEAKQPILESIRIATERPIEAYDVATKQLLARRDMVSKTINEASDLLDATTRNQAIALQTQRQTAYNKAQAAYAVGNTTQMNSALAEIAGIDNQIRGLDTSFRAKRMELGNQALGHKQNTENEMWKLQGDLAIRDLAVSGDPRRMREVMVNYMGMPVEIQRRSDGKYNIYTPDPQNPGKLITDPNKALDAKELSAFFMQNVSETYRTNKAQADALIATEAAKAQIKANADIQVEMAKTLGSINIEQVKGQWSVYAKQLEQSNEFQVTNSNDGSGRLFVMPKDGSGRVFSFDPNRPGTGPDGKIKPESFKLEFTMPMARAGLK